MARADARSIRFVRALLPDASAELNDAGQFVISLPDRVARLPQQVALDLASQGVLVISGTQCCGSSEAGAWLRRQAAAGDGFGAQHRSLVDEPGGATRNLDESPLARLAARGKDGAAPFLLPHQVEAGERLRRLVERARLTPRTTMSYDANRTARGKGGGGEAAAIGDTALDARRKLADLARALPRRLQRRAV